MLSAALQNNEGPCILLPAHNLGSGKPERACLTVPCRPAPLPLLPPPAPCRNKRVGGGRNNVKEKASTKRRRGLAWILEETAVDGRAEGGSSVSLSWTLTAPSEAYEIEAATKRFPPSDNDSHTNQRASAAHTASPHPQAHHARAKVTGMRTSDTRQSTAAQEHEACGLVGPPVPPSLPTEVDGPGEPGHAH